MTITLRVGTANIRNTPDLPRAQVREAARVCGKRADLVGFQEIAERADRLDVRVGLGESWRATPLTNTTEDPIHYRIDLVHLMAEDEVPGGFQPSGAKLAHHGMAHVSPDRYTTWGMFRAANDPKIQFAVVNLHTVSKPTDPGASHHKWREEMWHIHYSKFAAMVNGFNDAGLTVLAVGDFNRLDVPKTDRDMRWAWKSGIDKIGILKGKTPVSLIRVASYDTPSDHNLRVAKVALG